MEEEITVVVKIDDCESIASKYVKNNPTEAIDIFGLAYLCKLLLDNLMDLSEQELSMIDNCVRAEQHNRQRRYPYELLKNQGEQ